MSKTTQLTAISGPMADNPNVMTAPGRVIPGDRAILDSSSGDNKKSGWVSSRFETPT